MFFYVFISFLLDLLEEVRKVIPLEDQEFFLFFTLCCVIGIALSITHFLRLDAQLDLNDFVLLSLPLVLLLFDLLLKFFLAVLSLELLAHGKGDRA